MSSDATVDPGPVLETTRGCINTPRILFALEETGTACELVVRPSGYFETTHSMVGPLLREGNLLLLESTAILRHVARKYGLGVIWPTALDAQAQVDRWIDFFGGRIVWHIMRLSLLRSLPAEHQMPEVVGQEVEAFHRALGAADRWLAEREWLVGDFSAADCCATPMLRARTRYDLSRHTHLNRYFDRLQSRPALQRALARAAPAP